MTKAERKIYRKKYYQEHKYTEKEKRREYYKTHREQERQYYKDHKEKYNAYNKKYYSENKDLWQDFYRPRAIIKGAKKSVDKIIKRC
jgi:hypothetical protein